MGGVVDGGVDIGINSSPRQAAIEKAQAELRKEYDVREQRRRELEFLEKGGDPLDFRFGNVTSSLQSTSLNDRHREQFLSSEAKGSFALAASPHGDSVDSSGRPGAPSFRGRNGADNPVPFVGENQMHEGEKHNTHTGRKKITSSEQSSQMGGNRNAKESEDSAIFRPYARRNRSRTNRDGGRLSSADAIHTRGVQGPSVATRAGLRDGKGSSSEINNQKDQNAHSTSKPKIVCANGDMVSRTPTPESRLDVQIDDEQALLPITGLIKQSALTGDKFETTVKGLKDTRHKQPFGNRRASADVACKGNDTVAREEGVVSSGVDELPSANTQRDGDVSGKPSESGDTKVDIAPVTDKSPSASETTDRKDLESGMHPSVGLDVENNATCNDEANISSRGNTAEQRSEPEIIQKLEGSETTQEQNAIKTVENSAVVSRENSVAHQNQFGNGVIAKEDTHSRSTQLIKVDSASGECEEENRQLKEENVGDTEKTGKQILHNNPNIKKETSCVAIPPADHSSLEASTTSISRMESAAPECQPSGNYPRKVDKAYEDSILEEARIIEAKRRRIAELSVRSLLVESRQRCQWDFVLEEMTWLANDFAQERLWKMTAAAQLCHRVASASRLRFEEQSRQRNLKSVAHGLAKAVLQFWHSAEALLNGGGAKRDLKCNHLEGLHVTSDDVDSGGKTGDPDTESCEKLLLQTGRNTTGPIQGYAVRFLRDSKSHVYPPQVEAPETPDTVTHVDIMDLSWDNNLTEESLFYTVPSGAMEIYRKSIESYVTECERIGSNVQEEVGTSVFSTVAEQGYQDIAYEDEAETGTFYMSRTFGDSRSSKSALKKRKNPTRSYEQGADLPYGHYAVGSQSSTLIEKRPNLHVGPAPPKRTRTASRQRVISPFGPGPNAGVYSQAKNDASSGDTNSFHDDQNAIHGGSRVQKSMEVESAGEFEQNLPYDFAETSTKPKKKKKPKHLESTFEQSWQLGPAVLNDQREQSKKRLEHFESNGTSGLYGQHSAKRPKKSLDDTYDNSMAVPGSMPGQMASQMSNMSNQNRFIRYMGGRDKSRKVKALKTSSLHSGPGSTWSLFEDQALVVLVHDMGPNWELVSDAINSTLQFKCIFRKPKECKERHKLLMDKTDGADSAEDSGSSQSYPSTLPGIPKGSARQLFQRLHSPVEEDTLKEHFDKIIQITQRQHHRRIQLKNESQDTKQTAVHNSHFVSLSQVCPNNLSGVFLTPLDLIEATASSSDVLPLNYQGAHPGNLGVPNHGAVSSVPTTTTATNSPLPGGSTGVAHGSNMQSQSVPFSAPSRDGRYTVPKTSSSQGGDEQQQQRLPYNPMLSGRGMPHSNLSSPGTHPGSERGGRVLPPGNGLGMNRNMPMSRPGFQGIGSSTMLNSGSVVGTPSPVNMHSGANQGNSMLRPREPLHMVRGVAPELPMHAVNQGTAQGAQPFNGLGPAFSNQTSSPVQTYPGHSQQQPHPISPQLPPHAPNSPRHPPLPGGNQQQMYLRLAKDRNLQQRYLHQQQFGPAASNNLMPPLQNNPPTSQPTPSSPMTPAPLHHQQKPQLPPHGLARNTSTPISGPTNQTGKQQRQRQPQQQFQQSGRQHPQARPQQQPQGKLVKGINRGSMLVHQKLPVDPSHMNGLNVAPSVDNKEVLQGSGLYSGSSTNTIQPPKIAQSPLPSSPAALKQHNQHQVPASLSENSATSTSSSLMASNKQQPGQLQQQPHQNQVGGQTQPTAQRMLPLSRQMSLPIKSPLEKAKVEKKHVNTTAGAAMPPIPADSTNKVPAGSSAALPLQRKASEALSDAELPSTSGQVGSSTGSSTIQNSVRGEPLPSSLSQGSGGQKNLLDNTMAPRGGGLGSQWQQQQHPPQAKQALAAAAPAPQSSSSQKLEQQQQQPPQLQAQPQTQHMQAAQGNSFVGSANS